MYVDQDFIIFVINPSSPSNVELQSATSGEVSMLLI